MYFKPELGRNKLIEASNYNKSLCKSHEAVIPV